jgi:alpha-N-arabinofuranosidase
MNVVSCDFSVNTGIIVEKNLFGHNLEHTRSAIFQGLSAQVLRNRKFAGKPAAHSGEAAEWYRIGPENVFISLDPADPYVHNYQAGEDKFYSNTNELNCQVIQNPFNGQIAGIGQHGLALRNGEKYRAMAVLKGRGDILPDAKITIANSSGKPLAESSFSLTDHNWGRYEFIFPIESDEENAAFEITLNRRGELKVGVASLLPVDTFYGMRKDVVALMKELGISLLRWPGGNYSGEYRWKDGLLENDSRAPLFSYQPIETNPHSGGYDFHEIGIDEFIALCREIGAEPYLTINLGRDSPEESAQWVEYCNGGAGSEWGRKRVERGFADPYGVKYWSLGNEFGHGHMEGLNTPEAYVEKALRSAAAMKKADPTIILFASGPFTPERDPEPWVKTMLPLLAQEVSYISYHAYHWLFVHGVDFITNRGLRESYEKVIKTPEHWLKELTMLRSLLDTSGENIKRIGISFDEWNIFFAWFHNPGIIDGIFTALMLEMICKEYYSLNMPICMYFQPVNEGAITVYPLKSELTAVGQVFLLMKKHKGGLLLKTGSVEKNLHCLGTLHDTGSFIITLINRDYEKDITFKCDTKLPTVEKCILLDGSASILPGAKFIVTNIKPSSIFTVPPHSILQLEFYPRV